MIQFNTRRGKEPPRIVYALRIPSRPIGSRRLGDSRLDGVVIAKRGNNGCSQIEENQSEINIQIIKESIEII